MHAGMYSSKAASHRPERSLRSQRICCFCRISSQKATREMFLMYFSLLNRPSDFSRQQGCHYIMMFLHM